MINAYASECGYKEGLRLALQEEIQKGQQSIAELISRMDAGGDADKVTQLNNPEVLKTMKKKYGME